MAHDPVLTVARGGRLEQALLLGETVDVPPDDLADHLGLVAEHFDFLHSFHYGGGHRSLLAAVRSPEALRLRAIGYEIVPSEKAGWVLGEDRLIVHRQFLAPGKKLYKPRSRLGIVR